MALTIRQPGRVIIIFGLLVLAGLSFWLLRRLATSGDRDVSQVPELPDYYMEDFSTIVMGADGLPARRLRALYIEHYPGNDFTLLTTPTLELLDTANPVRLSADKGWVTDGDEVILLEGKVEILELNAAGEMRLRIRTEKVRILPDSGYAETDQYAEIDSARLRLTGTGMRAHLHEDRFEVLNDVHTSISKD
ncbi:MAG: LPS export ABC transporter periplasmic protein LptC [Gammaproteobacteria bacterium]|nr:MAG: LPS export ABC transporter periplasmic protein LptC [Gammaproteobacteria bacterium]